MPRRIGWAVLAAVVLIAVWWAWYRSGQPGGAYPVPGDGVRITVEVLNATGVDGLARASTRQLRRRGIDVVYFGTAATDTLRETLIAVRRGDTARAARVREALGIGRVVVEPDPRLLLDASVFLGYDAVPLVNLRP
ncbi:MAG: LytR C-terminal domain-containing protein [Gemmatimonadota bacterium]|nr:MAG: LytR C-terminal domain-containing protein [Gemmatimonadota bacterium]